MAKLQPEFTRRNCKIIGLSVDPVDDHRRWSVDIQDATGHEPAYPMIGDSDLAVAKHKVATPVNWKHGEDVIIVPAVSEGRALVRRKEPRSGEHHPLLRFYESATIP